MSDEMFDKPRPPSVYDLDKRLAVVESQQKDIKDELKAINHNISKLVWVVVGAVLVGMINMWAGGTFM